MRVDADPDWRVWRELRLEALQDTPIGYGERYGDAVALPDEEWQRRLARPGTRVVAFDANEPVGMGGTFRDEQGRLHVFGVYVRPAARGRGVPAALLGALEQPGEPLVLDVHEDNGRAQAAYEKLGFVLTGRTSPYELDPDRLLREMARPPVG